MCTSSTKSKLACLCTHAWLVFEGQPSHLGLHIEELGLRVLLAFAPMEILGQLVFQGLPKFLKKKCGTSHTSMHAALFSWSDSGSNNIGEETAFHIVISCGKLQEHRTCLEATFIGGIL
jgi:hypothetical protein